MKRQILILAFIGILINTYSQSELIWSKNFEVGVSNFRKEYPILESDGDTITVIGRKKLDSGQVLLIVNYDLNGDTISSMTYGNDSVFNNTLIDYKFDMTNHVYILQKEKLGFLKSKIVLQKYSLDGNLLWVAQIKCDADTSYKPHSLGLINDTCLFLSAYKQYDYPEQGNDVYHTKTISYLYSYNSSGNQLWQREFNPIAEINMFAYDKLFVHNNTAFLFTDENQLVTVDLNNLRVIYSNTGLESIINNIQLTPDNNLLITSWTGYRIFKTNLNGTILWTEYYGTNLPINRSSDEIIASTQDADGNIYITGRHYGDEYGTANYSNADILTIKYDDTGNIIWQNRYEYEINNFDIAYFITLKNGSVYVGGMSQRLGKTSDDDYLVLKIDSANGVTKGIYRYNGIANGNDLVSSLHVFDNGNVAITGLSYINLSYNWTTQLLTDIVKLAPNSNLSVNLDVYPNPIYKGNLLSIKGNGFVEYSIISTIGQLIQQGKLEEDELNTIQLDNISTGLYIIQLKTGEQTLSRKIIVI